MGLVREETNIGLFGKFLAYSSLGARHLESGETFIPVNKEVIFPRNSESPDFHVNWHSKEKPLFSIRWKTLAIACIVAVLSFLCIGFFSSCSSDEEDELIVETQLLISLKDGSSSIDGMVYVFPDGDYDPKTFTVSSLGSIETKSGQKVTGIGAGSYKKNGGYCKYNCKPGNYYVVGVYLGSGSWGGMPHQSWKGVKATATKNKGTVVEIKMSTSSIGCQN